MRSVNSTDSTHRGENGVVAMITVLRDRYVPGNCSHIGVQQLGLGEALARRWDSDCHFQQCVASRRQRSRLTSSDVGVVPIELGCIAFDVDGPNHEASEQWRGELNA